MKVLLKIFYNSYMILLKVKYNKKVVISKCSKYLNVVIIVNVIFISLYFTSNKETENIYYIIITFK